MSDRVSFKGYAIVSCGTLRPELERLRQAGFLDADKVLYTAPGLHEWPWKLEEQFPRQLAAARRTSERLIVLYGEKCFIDTSNPSRVTDALIREHCPEAVRVKASNCVDMLASKEQREMIAGREKVYWLTPGWLEYWDFIFKDWDMGKANEMFPQHDRALVLDAIDYFDQTTAKSPEKILRISDWMRLPIERVAISSDRLKALIATEVTGAAD